MKRTVTALFALCVMVLASCNANAQKQSATLVKLPAHRANVTVNYKAITVYFNPKWHIPNCVAYELTSTMTSMADAPGAERRKDYKFNCDEHVAGCPTWGDYRGSGYTRGHMAPAMDMRWSKQSMRECFYMTNICPQEAKLNNDHWRQLEEKVHAWARRDGRIVVLTGPIVDTATPRTIGRTTRGIVVPDAFFKVLYSPEHNRGIAFIYANKPCPGSMSRYAVTIDEVERRTGLDFFTTLPKNVERNIESQCDLSRWQ